jgi:hypothetical protein
MKRFLLAATALAALCGPTLGADLPAVLPLKAAIVAPAGIWAGCYASMEAASVGGDGVSGGPAAGGAAECWYQNGAFLYSYGLDMLFTKLSTPLANSPFTAAGDIELGFALHPGLGTFGMLPLNDVRIYAGAALPASLVNSLGGSAMETGWMAKGGIATALTYTPTGLVQTSFGVEGRFTRVNGQDANTLMFVLSTRM